MHFSTLLFSALSLISLTSATQTARPALKDSTIFRSTEVCESCPNKSCYECTLGHNETLRVQTGGVAYIRSLIGFRLPVPATSVTKCTVQFPGFVTLPQKNINVTVSRAMSSNWDEDTVNGENAPIMGVVFNSVEVEAESNLPAIDVTFACKKAAKDRRFSIFLGAQSGSFAVWSKDSGNGNPAILHITYDE